VRENILLALGVPQTQNLACTALRSVSASGSSTILLHVFSLDVLSSPHAHQPHTLPHQRSGRLANTNISRGSRFDPLFNMQAGVIRALTRADARGRPETHTVSAPSSQPPPRPTRSCAHAVACVQHPSRESSGLQVGHTKRKLMLFPLAFCGTPHRALEEMVWTCMIVHTALTVHSSTHLATSSRRSRSGGPLVGWVGFLSTSGRRTDELASFSRSS
jgi:hypothetical protein